MNNENPNNLKDKMKNINNTADTTAEFDPKDISDNKGISVLSYLGPLVFIPMFAKKDSKFARFHANQGLTMFITYVGYSVVQSILLAILRMIFPWNYNYGLIGGRGFIFNALSTILSLLWIPITVIAIIGIVNAASGKAKELPLIGKIKLLK